MRFFWQKKTQPTITATTPAGAYIATKGTPSGIEPSQDVADYTYNVVGESFRHDHLVQLIQNHKAVNDGTIFTSATLKLEPENVFDPTAVMVIVEGLHVGYIAKSQSGQMTESIKRLKTTELEVPAHLGWDTDNPQPYIGVQLMLGELDPSL